MAILYTQTACFRVTMAAMRVSWPMRSRHTRQGNLFLRCIDDVMNYFGFASLANLYENPLAKRNFFLAFAIWRAGSGNTDMCILSDIDEFYV